MINKQMARQTFSTILGKAVKKAASLRGGGSALPGLVIEKIDPKFLSRTLEQIPLGVVIISGTNGKTTTTKIVVELLEAAGLKVFTNRTGSNFSRGVAAALLGEVDMRGRINADIAVLELDEAWAAKFVQQIQPNFTLLLNVMRDQLDRFGEIDTTAKLLEKIALATTGTVILNRDDPRIFAISNKITAKKAFFGTTTSLLSLMPTDDALKHGGAQANQPIAADVLLKDIDNNTATYAIDGQDHSIKLRLSGAYNLLNAAAALSLARHILQKAGKAVKIETLLESLSKVQPAFGRGETIELGGRAVEIILVKNPSGFRLALLSSPEQEPPTMIAVNDNYADGRDMSWLWDVDFSKLKAVSIVSGVRAYDMALRLAYDDISPNNGINPDIDTALDTLLASHPSDNLRIYATYTAMLRIRKKLSTLTAVKDVR